MNTAARRLHFVDALKAIASQFIVLHHLAFYGPLSLAAYALAPGEITWFARYARIAVQIFLVIGGFLAARSLAPQGRLAAPRPAALLGKRYLRLALPYVVMLVFSVVCAALARQWMDDDSIPAAPTVWQFTSHILLLHGILEVDSLSAGVWYVAIDFQLFALTLGLLWLTERARHPWIQRMGPAVIGAIGLASLFFFNRDAAWDDWAVYFFGAYAMGAMAYWGTRPGGRHWLVIMGVAVVAALYVDYRARIAVALVTALLLALSCRGGWIDRWPRGAALAFLGRISYSVFLVHFPICLLANAIFDRFLPDAPVVAVVGLLVAWAASIAGGTVFHRHVESRAGEWMSRLINGARRVSSAA
ncbi:MAG: acyltransferase [Rhodocyclaceae bacterium]